MTALPAITLEAAFPVPTPSNPNAIYRKERLVEFSASSTTGEDNANLLKNEIAKALEDNRVKVTEDYRRRENFEQTKKKWKVEEETRWREEKKKTLDCLGLPESCAFLLDTAQFAMKQYRDAEAKGDKEPNDADAKVYQRSVKRILGNTDGTLAGGEKLMKDLEDRAAKNEKRARLASDVNDGVNKGNARFNKSVERTMSKDARAQTIKQNLERGTAL
jgi:hypothetical protein